MKTQKVGTFRIPGCRKSVLKKACPIHCGLLGSSRLNGPIFNDWPKPFVDWVQYLSLTVYKKTRVNHDPPLIVKEWTEIELVTTRITWKDCFGGLGWGVVFVGGWGGGSIQHGLPLPSTGGGLRWLLLLFVLRSLRDPGDGFGIGGHQTRTGPQRSRACTRACLQRNCKNNHKMEIGGKLQIHLCSLVSLVKNECSRNTGVLCLAPDLIFHLVCY